MQAVCLGRPSPSAAAPGFSTFSAHGRTHAPLLLRRAAQATSLLRLTVAPNGVVSVQWPKAVSAASAAARAWRHHKQSRGPSWHVSPLRRVAACCRAQASSNLNGSNATATTLGADLLACCKDIVLAQIRQGGLHIDGPHTQLEANVRRAQTSYAVIALEAAARAVSKRLRRHRLSA